MWTRRRLKKGCCKKGFTLIEILTAMFILTIVVSLVLGSFDGVFSSADHINASTDLFEMGNTALNRISADLSAFHAMPYPRYTPPDIDDDPELYRLVAEQRTVGGTSFTWFRFTSLAHLPLNQVSREGIAQIVYYVQESPENGFILKRSDTLYPYPEFEENQDDPVVCEQLREFKLVFFDDDNQALEEWDSEDDDLDFSTPRAVGIRLAVGEKEAPFVFQTQIVLPTYREQTEQR